MPADAQPTDERMVFSVPSDTNPTRSYRCDLLALGGYGMCSCTDWGTRRSPAIKAGAKLGSRVTLCKHLLRAQRAFLNDLLPRMAKEEGS